MPSPTVTWLTPPSPSSLPAERSQLEFSSRSVVFAEDGGRLLRAWGPPEAPWPLAVEAVGARWRVEAWGADPPVARRAVRALFSLDHPLPAFYRLTGREPVLRGTPRRFRGLRLPRDASVYESLLHAIVGQQLSVRAANAIHRRLLARDGAPLRAGRIEVPCVPTPARLAALAPEELRAVGLSRAKATALRALARDAADDSFSPSALASLPREAAVEALDRRPGVGRWTAENALLRGVGRTDIFVAGDLGIRVALARYGAVGRDRPEGDARAWADRWYPGWGTYATLYLWRRLVADRAAAETG